MALVVGENTYITLTEAEEYFATRYNSGAWDDLTDSVKIVLLQSATRALDLYCDWLYDKTDVNQDLQHPRNGKTTVDDYIKVAESEIAFSILESENVSETNEPNLLKLKADVVELTFGETSNTSSIYNDFTNRLLSDYCFASGASGSKRLTRV